MAGVALDALKDGCLLSGDLVNGHFVQYSINRAELASRQLHKAPIFQTRRQVVAGNAFGQARYGTRAQDAPKKRASSASLAIPFM